jgi:hypothetical protein
MGGKAMKKRWISVMLAAALMATPVNAYAESTLDNVKEYLSELDGNGGYFELQEVQLSDDSLTLQITSFIDYTGESGESNNFIFSRDSLYKEMFQEDWFNYTYVFDNTYVRSRLNSTKMYNLNDNYSCATTWFDDGLEYEELSTGESYEYYPGFKETTPFEDNQTLQMYYIAKDIITSNFQTFPTYPEYYVGNPDVRIKFDDEKAEVVGVVSVDYKNYAYCVQFSYKGSGWNYTYDTSYVFIEGIGASGTYVPMS